MNTRHRSFLTLVIYTIIISAVLLGMGTGSQAATKTASVTGNWSSTTTWGGAAVPGVGDDVIINSSVTVTLSAAGTCASLTNSGTVSTSGNQTLTVAGSVSGSGTMKSGATNRTLTIVLSSGDWNFAGSVNTTNKVSLSFTGAADQTLNGNQSFSVITLNKTGGTLFITDSPTAATRTLTNGNVNYSAAAAQTILGGTYPADVTFSGGAVKTTAVAVTINGNLTVSADTTLNLAGFNFTVKGTTTVAGTLDHTSTTGTKTFTGDVIINSGGSWKNTINEAITFGGNLQNNGTFNSGTAVNTFSGTGKTISGTVSISKLTISGTTTNTGTLTVATTLAGTGTLTNGATGTLKYSGSSITPTLIATAGGNTVNYSGAAQTVKATTYSNLILSGSRAKTLATGTSVTGTLSIAPSGTATAKIGAGLNLSVGSLTLVGLGRINGSWGGTNSGASYVNATYFAATTGKMTVSTDTRQTPVTPTLTVTNAAVYDTSAHAATVSATDSVPGSVTNILTGGAATKTSAGSYAVTADYLPTDTTAYKTITGIPAGTFVINKAAVTVTLSGLLQSWDNTAKSVTATTNPSGVALTITYNGSSAAPKNIGNYAVVAAVVDTANYQGGTTATLTINLVSKLTASISLGGLSQIYDGTPRNISAITEPAGLGVDFTYNGSTTVPTNAGSYAVVGTINDTYYEGLASGTLVITKAAATLTLESLNQSWDGNPKTAAATTTPPGLTVDFTYNGTGSAPSDPGSYLLVGTVNDTNYQGTAAGTFIINRTPAFTSAAGATFAFDETATDFIITTAAYPVATLAKSGGLPTGVTFWDNGNGTATISGTPNISGSFPLKITATNSAGTTIQLFTLTVPVPNSSTLSAVDSELSVTPNRHLFGVETLNACAGSTPSIFSVRNAGSSPRTLGTLTFDGNDAGEFSFGTDTCSGTTLNAGASCSVAVKFCPTSVGSKAASLLIPSNDPETPTMAAFLYNYESIGEEAARRLPPVLESLSIPATMTSGQQYTITWSQLGYDEDYVSRIYLFNCAGVAAGTCGDSVSTKIADSGNLIADSTTPGAWSYNGVSSKRFSYSYTFTAPTVAVATDFVIRFFYKNMDDDAAGLITISLLVPGNLVPAGTSYYDVDGRRLKHVISP